MEHGRIAHCFETLMFAVGACLHDDLLVPFLVDAVDCCKVGALFWIEVVSFAPWSSPLGKHSEAFVEAVLLHRNSFATCGGGTGTVFLLDKSVGRRVTQRFCPSPDKMTSSSNLRADRSRFHNARHFFC